MTGNIHTDSVSADVATNANVLCLHGLCAGSWTFEALLPMIAARGYNAHAISYRGHPPNPPLKNIGRVSVAEYAREAGQVARALDRPIVIGHSLGGLVALMLAGRNLIRAAVLISPAPPRGISIFSPAIVLRMLNYLPAMVFSGPLRMREGDVNAMVLNRIEPAKREAIRRRFVADSGCAARQVTLGKYRIPARAVRVPLLIVCGDEDRFIPLRVSQRVARKYDAPLHVARNHGHFLFGEPGWETEAGRILDWIDGLPRVVRDASADQVAPGAREPQIHRADS